MGRLTRAAQLGIPEGGEGGTATGIGAFAGQVRVQMVTTAEE